MLTKPWGKQTIFIFCNNYVKPHSNLVSFGWHVLQWIPYHVRVSHSLYNWEKKLAENCSCFLVSGKKCTYRLLASHGLKSRRKGFNTALVNMQRILRWNINQIISRHELEVKHVKYLLECSIQQRLLLRLQGYKHRYLCCISTYMPRKMANFDITLFHIHWNAGIPIIT